MRPAAPCSISVGIERAEPTDETSGAAQAHRDRIRECSCASGAPSALDPAGALFPFLCGGSLRCTARAVGSPAGLSQWQWVRAVPKLLSFRDRSAVPSLHVPTFPWRLSPQKEMGIRSRLSWSSHKPLSPVVSSGALADPTPRGECEGTHRVLLSRSVPSVPRPHHEVKPAAAVAGVPPSCRLTASPPPPPLAGSPFPWVTGLPRRCPGEIAESAVALLRRPWHKGSLMGPARAGGPAAAETPCSDPREGKQGDPRGGELHPLPQFPPSCRLGEGRLPCSGLQPTLTTAHPTMSSPAWELWSRESQPSQDHSLPWTPSPFSLSRILSLAGNPTLAGPPALPGSPALSQPPAPWNPQTSQDPHLQKISY